MGVARRFGGWTVVGAIVGVLSGPTFGQEPQMPADGRPPISETVTADTAAAVIEKLEQRWQIERDGTARQTTAARIRIRESAALASFAHLYFAYVPATESIELVALRVDKANGQQVTVDAAALKEVPTQESGSFEGPTFSDARVKQVSVPALGVGDVLSYELVLTRHTPVAQGHFWAEFAFTSVAIVLEETLELDWAADLPLSIRLSGRGITEQTDVPARSGRVVRRWAHRQPQLTSVDRSAVVKLATAAARGQGALPDLQVSTFRTWDDVATWYRNLAGGAETPSAVVADKARSLTQSATTPQTALAALHKFVAQDVRYVSLAFGDGRYRPRRADLVLSTQYGDCKDKHSLLASLAREAGFAVEPVLINTTRPLDEALPSPGQFNHVITRVTGKGLEPTWIDGTVAVTRAGVLLLPLRGKKGLRVGTTAELIETPAAHPDPQRVHVAISGSYQADGRYRATIRRELQGDFEAALRGAIGGSDQQARRKAAEGTAKEDGYGKDSTIVRVAAADPTDLDTPFWWEYEVEAKYSSPHRATAYAFWIPTPEVELPAPGDDDQDVDLGPAATLEVTAQFELPGALAITPPVPVSIDNHLASYTSRYSADKGLLRIERTLKTKVTTATPVDLNAYRALRRAADGDYRQKFAVPAATAENLRTIAAGRDLAAAGYQALEDGDVARSVELLSKAVAAEPTHSSAWNNLGRAYYQQGEWATSIDAYNRQLALDPFDEYAYNNRGLSEWRLGKHAEAEASFQKQVEVSPLDKHAHKNLGDLLLERGRAADARDAYTKAASITPDSAWVYIGTARAMLALGQREEAVPYFQRAVQASATPPVWNDAAWRMVEAGVALDTALDYARSAVAAASTATSAASVDKPAGPQIGLSASLAAYWDTLGWIQFKRGQIESARSFVRASWQVAQNAIVGEHLGDIYQRLGRKRDAFIVYRTALGLPNPGDGLGDKVRGLAQTLVPPPQTATSATLVLEARTVKLTRFPGAAAPTEVTLVIDPRGAVVAARAVGEGTAPQSIAQALVGTMVPLDAPDAVPFSLVAHGAVACRPGGGGCSLVIFRPEDAMARTRRPSADR